jgi:orotate phosphoribosyltransferase-like protein
LTKVSYYLCDACGNIDSIVKRARVELENTDYDTLVGTGLSGTLVVPVLARELGKFWLIARKPNDGSHSMYRAEGQLGARWVFVDDQIDSGETRDRVIRTVTSHANHFGHITEHVGTFLYN